jgi:hypothetical protein
MLASNPLHQLLVYFTYQPERQGERKKALDPMLKRYHVVANLFQIVRTSVDGCPGIRRKQFSQCGLRSFDTAGEHGFPLEERAHEQMWIG